MAKRRGAEFWNRHVEAWSHSGLTQAAYCKAHGLTRKSFYRWRGIAKKATAKPSSKSSLTLVPISVAAAAIGGTVQLHSPGGWKVELPKGDASWLADLLRQLP
jgi:hypothetical protein